MHISKRKKTLVYSEYEIKHNITVSDDFVKALEEDENLPKFYTPYDFISRCYGSYHSKRAMNKHIHDIYDMANHAQKYYRIVKIPKKSGKVRKLTIPCDELKYVQTYILRHMFTWFKPSVCANAYLKDRGVLRNALPHVKKNYILKLDISSFFDNIDYSLVVDNILPKDIYPLSFRMLIANLCTYKYHLPQGAPTSPMISNIIMKDFDEELLKYCKKKKIAYTRYADDMTFSSDDLFDRKELTLFVSDLLIKKGMELNKDKIIFLHNGQRKQICSVVVNDHMQVSKTYRDKIRMEMYYLNKFGLKDHLMHLKCFKKLDANMTRRTYLYSLLGRIRYVLFVNEDDEEFIKYKTIVTGYIEKESYSDEDDNIILDEKEIDELFFEEELEIEKKEQDVFEFMSASEIIIYCLHKGMDIPSKCFGEFQNFDSLEKMVIKAGTKDFFNDGFKEEFEKYYNLFHEKYEKERKHHFVYFYLKYVYLSMYGSEEEKKTLPALEEWLRDNIPFMKNEKSVLPKFYRNK